MELSILVAKVYAVVALLMGLGILANSKHYRKTFLEMLESKVAIFYGGIIALVVGILLISYHNVWEKSWIVIITVIGWGALVKGIALILFPDRFKFLKKFYKSSGYWNVQAVAIIVLGLVLGYFGFIA
jgi:hypothetical protein